MNRHRPEIVFVYGTLRRQGVNYRLLRRARYLGRHRTAPAYTMIDLGGYPGVVRGGRTAIEGELYGVDKPTLAMLDQLEDYPRLYDRDRIVTTQGTGLDLFVCLASGQ